MKAFKKKKKNKTKQKFTVSTQTSKEGNGFSVKGLKHQRLTFYQWNLARDQKGPLKDNWLSFWASG